MQDINERSTSFYTSFAAYTGWAKM